MNGPSPAKMSNCILRLLDDSDFMPKSSILALLQYSKVQGNPYKMASKQGVSPSKLIDATVSRQETPNSVGGK